MSATTELNRCSAFGCDAQSVGISNFFVSPTDPDMGIKFQFCKAHQAYYQYLITIVDMCQTTVQQMGKWVFGMPPTFSQYQKAIKDAEAKGVPK